MNPSDDNELNSELSQEDSEMSDQFLKQLLQYRDNLLSDEFVEAIMQQILNFQRLRKIIIISCTILGLVGLYFAEINLIPNIQLFNFDAITSEFAKVSTDTVSVSVVTTLLSLGVWLITSD